MSMTRSLQRSGICCFWSIENTPNRRWRQWTFFWQQWHQVSIVKSSKSPIYLYPFVKKSKTISLEHSTAREDSPRVITAQGILQTSGKWICMCMHVSQIIVIRDSQIQIGFQPRTYMNNFSYVILTTKNENGPKLPSPHPPSRKNQASWLNSSKYKRSDSSKSVDTVSGLPGMVGSSDSYAKQWALWTFGWESESVHIHQILYEKICLYIYTFNGGRVWVWFHYKSLSLFTVPPLSISRMNLLDNLNCHTPKKRVNTKHVWTLSSWTWTPMKPFSTSFGTTAVSIAFAAR